MYSRRKRASELNKTDWMRYVRKNRYGGQRNEPRESKVRWCVLTRECKQCKRNFDWKEVSMHSGDCGVCLYVYLLWGFFFLDKCQKKIPNDKLLNTEKTETCKCFNTDHHEVKGKK